MNLCDVAAFAASLVSHIPTVQLPLQIAAGVFIISFGVLNRVWGMKRKGKKTKGVKGLVIAVLLLVGFVAGSPAGAAGAAYAAAFLADRSIPYFRSSAAPTTALQRVFSLFRHALVALPLLAAVTVLKLPAPQVAIPFAGYILAAWAIAMAYGRVVLKDIQRGVGIGNENVICEVGKGAIYGLAIFVATRTPVTAFNHLTPS